MRCVSCRNQHQPSRGITTRLLSSVRAAIRAGININPVAGLQRPTICPTLTAIAPESTSTQSRDYNLAFLTAMQRVASRNQHQPSRGITTLLDTFTAIEFYAGININPVAGLQLLGSSPSIEQLTAGININPVAGLQQEKGQKWFCQSPCRNQHQPSRGITTVDDHVHHASNAMPESTSTQSRDYNFVYVTSVNVDIRRNQHQPSRGITTNLTRLSLLGEPSRNQHQPSRGITTTVGTAIRPVV